MLWYTIEMKTEYIPYTCFTSCLWNLEPRQIAYMQGSKASWYLTKIPSDRNMSYSWWIEGTAKLNKHTV